MDRRTKRELLGRLEADASLICARFRLRYRVLEAERANVKRRYGVCYSDGTIRIRLRHATSGRPLKYSSLVNTLCHELAHLKHFNHGPRFQNLYAEILGWARREKIYQPRAPRDAIGPAAAVGMASSGASTEANRTLVHKPVAPATEPSGSATQLELFG